MRRLLLALAALGVLTVGSIAHATEGEIGVRAVDPARFPVVDVTISINGTAPLEAHQIRMLENGVPVKVVGLDTLGGTGQGVDAVLAIDVSNSMQGTQLETALAAARAFVANVPSTLPVGVVSFAESPVVQSPITSDRTAVQAAVGTLSAQTSQGTSLFDAVVAASRMFEGKDVQHNLVLLTDGRNTTGRADLEAAVAAAEAANVNVFTISLAGGSVDLLTLDDLAERTGGASSSITPEDLTGVYTDLAREFGQQYVVSYRSKAPYGAASELEIRTPFGVGSTRFLTPALSGVAQENPGAAQESFVTSDMGLVLVTALVFLSVVNALLLLSAVLRRRRREAQLRSRLVADPTAEADAFAAAPGAPWIPRAVTDVAERTAKRAGVLDAISLRLHQAGWRIRVGEFLTLMVIAGAIGGGVGWYYLGTLGLGVALPVALLPFTVLSSAASKRLGKIQAQLADTLLVIASSLRAGHSFLQALDTVTKEIEEPARSEFTQTMSEVRFGRDVDEALDALVERTGSKDLDWAVTAIKIQRKIGGNLAEVLESVANTIRERETLRRQVRVLSAEGRISALVLTVLPILIALYLVTVNPEYLEVLTQTRTGVVLLTAGGGLMVLGYLWMQRIVKVDDI